MAFCTRACVVGKNGTRACVVRKTARRRHDGSCKRHETAERCNRTKRPKVEGSTRLSSRQRDAGDMRISSHTFPRPESVMGGVLGVGSVGTLLSKARVGGMMVVTPFRRDLGACQCGSSHARVFIALAVMGECRCFVNLWDAKCGRGSRKKRSEASPGWRRARLGVLLEVRESLHPRLLFSSASAGPSCQGEGAPRRRRARRLLRV